MPGRKICARVMCARMPAFSCDQQPGQGRGGGRAGDRFRRHRQRLAVLRGDQQALGLHLRHLQRADHRTDSKETRPAAQRLFAARHQRHHPHHVQRGQIAVAAHPVRLAAVVRPRPDAFGVDGRHGDVVRPDVHLRVVDVLAGIHQLDVAHDIGVGGRPALARLRVEDVRRRAQAGEVDAIAADLQTELRIEAVQRELLGRLINRPAHQLLRDAHTSLSVVHVGPGLAENRAGPAVIHPDADRRQDFHRSFMDAFDLSPAQNLEARCLHAMCPLRPPQPLMRVEA